MPKLILGYKASGTTEKHLTDNKKHKRILLTVKYGDMLHDYWMLSMYINCASLNVISIEY
jgi:hypothetical protein